MCCGMTESIQEEADSLPAAFDIEYLCDRIPNNTCGSIDDFRPYACKYCLSYATTTQYARQKSFPTFLDCSDALSMA